MVKKTLLVAGVLFALYTVFISKVKPYWSISQHQWQDNQIKAEKYLYDSQARNVLVGSSLSGRLGELPGVYNLALAGQSVLDGLAILNQKRAPLRTVFIEMNFFDRAEDHNFTDVLRNPILEPAKRVFMSLRADKQPLAVAWEKAQGVMRSLLNPLGAQVPLAATKAPTPFDKMLQFAVEEHTHTLAPDVVHERFATLHQQVALLEARGTRVVFFEMPEDSHLCQTVRANAIRAVFKQQFAPVRYQYIAAPACGLYQTTDAIHLNAESAARYTQYLQKQIKSLQ